MTDETDHDVTAHDERMHYRCPFLGGQVPFRHCRTTDHGMPCARIVACWEHVFDVRAFLAAHYDPAELEARWRRPRKDKRLTLVDLIRQARGEADGSQPA